MKHFYEGLNFNKVGSIGQRFMMKKGCFVEVYISIRGICYVSSF